MIPDVLDALGIDVPDPEDMIDEIFEEEEQEILPEKPQKKKKKKKKTEEKKNKDDFGNDWADWSPDPNDYLR